MCVEGGGGWGWGGGVSHSPGHINPVGASEWARNVSRSVALSMLGYSCRAHSYWQRCHKTKKMWRRGEWGGCEESGRKGGGGGWR